MSSELDDLIKKLLNKTNSKTAKVEPSKPKVENSDLITAAGYSDEEGCLIANSATILSDKVSFEEKMNCLFHMAKSHHTMKAALACAAIAEALVEAVELLQVVDLRAKTELLKDTDVEKVFQRRKRCLEIVKDVEKHEQRKTECVHSGVLH